MHMHKLLHDALPMLQVIDKYLLDNGDLASTGGGSSQPGSSQETAGSSMHMMSRMHMLSLESHAELDVNAPS